MGLSKSIGVRADPILNHNFVVTLLDTSSTLSTLKSVAKSVAFDVVLGGFMECTGLEIAMQVEEYREGGRNGEVLKFPGHLSWSNITLKKGIGGTGMWDWMTEFGEGKGKRRDGLIVLLSDLHVPNNIWYFRRGLPLTYTAPSMNAKQSEVAVESVVISHEGVYQVPYVWLGAAAAGAIAGFAT